MAAIPYTIGQGDKITLSNPSRIVAVGGDNGTGFYLNFPDMPQGQQWVAPNTFGFMYLVDSPRIGIGPRVDASLTPPWGTTPAPGQTTKALITAYDTDQLFDAGITSPATVNATIVGQPVQTDPIDRAGRLLGIVASITATVLADVSDRAARLLGVADVSDRAARLLGVVASITAAVDISDRAGRLLGVINSITNTVANAPTLASQQGTGTVTSVAVPASAGSNATLAAANSNRRGLILYSEGVTGTVIINQSGGGEMFQIPSGGYWEMPVPILTTAIQVTASANAQGGTIKVTELT